VILDHILPERTKSKPRRKITPVVQKHFLCYATRKSKRRDHHRLPSPRSTGHRAEGGAWSVPTRAKKGGDSVKGLLEGRLYLPPSWPGPKGPGARPGGASSAGTGRVCSRCETEWKALASQLKMRAFSLHGGNIPEGLKSILQSDDARSIWALSDHPDGKALLQGTDWMGKLLLKDKEAMARYNAYARR